MPWVGLSRRRALPSFVTDTSETCSAWTRRVGQSSSGRFAGVQRSSYGVRRCGAGLCWTAIGPRQSRPNCGPAGREEAAPTRLVLPYPGRSVPGGQLLQRIENSAKLAVFHTRLRLTRMILGLRYDAPPEFTQFFPRDLGLPEDL